MSKKYIFVPGDRHLCRRVNASGEASGSYLIAHTPAKSRSTKYISTRTSDLDSARTVLSAFLKKGDLLQRKGYDLTYDAMFAVYKQEREAHVVSWAQVEDRWRAIQPTLGVQRPARCKMLEGDKPGSFFAGFLDDVFHARNGTRINPRRGGRAKPMKKRSSLIPYIALLSSMHKTAIDLGKIPSDMLPMLPKQGRSEKRPKYFNDEEVAALLTEGERLTGNGRPHRLHLFLLIALSGGVRVDRIRSGLWDLVDWELRTIDYPRAFSPVGSDMPDAKHLTNKKAPVVKISAQLMPVLRNAYAYDLARCEGSETKVRRLPILGKGTRLADAFNRMTLRVIGRKGTPHMCKHTAVTLALAKGADLLDVCDRFSITPDTALSFYRHAIPKDDQKIADLILGTGRRKGPATGNVVKLRRVK